MIYEIDPNGYMTLVDKPTTTCRLYRRKDGSVLVDCPQLGGVSKLDDEEAALPDELLFRILAWRIQKARFAGYAVIGWA